MGGRSIFTAATALFAYSTVRFSSKLFGLQEFDFQKSLSLFHLRGDETWALTVVIGLVCGIVGTLAIRLIRYIEEGLSQAAITQTRWRIPLGIVILACIYFIYPLRRFLRGLFSGTFSILNFLPMKWPFYLSQASSGLALVVSVVGITGLFWLLFVLGSLIGFELSHLTFISPFEFPLAAGLMGGAAFFGAVLGAPFAGAVIGFELSQNIHLFVACLLASLLAQQLRWLLQTKSLMFHQLKSRDLSLSEGRSLTILDSLTVQDAMVTDYEVVYEHENVTSLYEKGQKSKYPFLMVVNLQGIYKGLLPVDLIQESWKDQSQTSLSTFVEAKDLLYRSEVRFRTLKMSDRLSLTSGMFDHMPCAPVLGEQGRACGLLFTYHVRLAYDREVGRRSFSFVREVEDHD